jgi:ribosomal protein L24E
LSQLQLIAKERPTKTCELCGEAFSPTYLGRPQRYCSVKCRRNAWTRRNPERTKELHRAAARRYYRRNRPRLLEQAVEYNRRWRTTPEGKAKKRAQGLRRYYRDVEKSRERQRESYRRRRAKRFGITVTEWNAILERGCAICGAHPEGRFLHLDHDHANGKVRDALCQGCNTGIGSLADNPARLRAAADYIESHRS